MAEIRPHKDYPAHAETAVADLDPNLSLSIMARMVGERKQVLDLGCATGYFARVLRRQQCEVTGIDSNPSAVAAARAHCAEALVADLDTVPLGSILAGNQFDVVVFGDVLEHLGNPSRLLEDARGVLRARGFVVASIPNVAHGAVRLSLLNGRFDYQELGILDDSHKRFFTLKSIEELFLASGYRIDALERTQLGIFQQSELLPAVDRSAFGQEAIDLVEADPESTTLQFVVRAVPLSDESRYRTMTKRFLAANTELSALRATVDAQASAVQELESRLAQREKELSETRQLLAEADRQMRKAQNDYQLIAQTSGSTDILSERISGLEDALRCLREEHEQHFELLRAPLDEHAVVSSQRDALVLERDDLLVRLHKTESELLASEASLSKSRTAEAQARAALATAHAEIDTLGRTLTAQITSAAAAARAHSEDLASSIDRIQSGRIWQLKRLLRRILRRRTRQPSQ